MKRIFLLLITLACLQINAQEKFNNNSFSVRVGMNLSNELNSNNSSQSPHSMRCGLIVGADYEHRFTKKWGLSTGLYYSQQGYNHNRDNYGYYEGDNMVEKRDPHHVDYLVLPVNVNFYAYRGLYVSSGLNVCFKLKSDYDVRTMNLSLPIGVGYDFGKLIVDFRYRIGLTHLYRYENFPDISSEGMGTNLPTKVNYEGRSSVLSFTVGYRFGL